MNTDTGPNRRRVVDPRGCSGNQRGTVGISSRSRTPSIRTRDDVRKIEHDSRESPRELTILARPMVGVEKHGRPRLMKRILENVTPVDRFGLIYLPEVLED